MKSGAGAGQGFASCAEMGFITLILMVLIRQQFCIFKLKEGVTEEILSIKSIFFKNLAYFIYLDEYSTNLEYRVQGMAFSR